MAIIIQEQKPEIPVEIGKLKFKFIVTDESVKDFRVKGAQIKQELESMQMKEDDDAAIEQIKEVLKKGFDLMLGNGAFEQIYDMTPSVMYLTSYFVQLSNGLHEELISIGAFDTVQKKAQKYTRNKNRNRQNR
ncbi:hypothetical protein [Bacillus nitroreducens]